MVLVLSRASAEAIAVPVDGISYQELAENTFALEEALKRFCGRRGHGGRGGQSIVIPKMF